MKNDHPSRTLARFAALSRAELEDKALRLARYRNGASDAETRTVIGQIRAMEATSVVSDLLPARRVQ